MVFRVVSNFLVDTGFDPPTHEHDPFYAPLCCILQLIWMSPAKRRRKVRQVAKHSHKHLQLLEIVGYYGRTSDVELAVYFIENAVSLQKIIIDPRYQVLERTPIDNDQVKKEKAARCCAKKQIEPRTPQGVELVIL